MTFAQSAILGVIQGFTEFLPVSSSGHLILGAELMGLPAPGLSFSIFVHVGTMLATLVMLYKEIWWLIRGLFSPRSKNERSLVIKILGFLVLGSIPAAIVGLTLSNLVERAFTSTIVASLGLIATGAFLWLSKGLGQGEARGRIGHGDTILPTVTFGNALGVGLAQAVAIIPGVSRSGSTITTGLFLGIGREDAARFSFLLSIPAVFGAALLDIRSLVKAGQPVLGPGALIGGLVSFVAGLIALLWVFRLVRQGAFYRFSYYCLVVGILGLALSILR